MAKEGKRRPDGGQGGLLSEEEMEVLAVLDRDPGGPLPSKSILKLGSHKKEVSNQFKEEQEVVFSVHARCDYVSFGGGKRVHEFDVLDIFQDEDLDEGIVERFKDKLEGYDASEKTKEMIEKFLEACLEEPDGDRDVSPAQPAASAEEPEEPSEPPERQTVAAPPDPGNMGVPEAEEDAVEVVEGELMPESDEAAMDAAAGDLDWG